MRDIRDRYLNAVRAPAQKLEARMSQHEFHEHGQFRLAIKCHWCGNEGVSVWEKTQAGRQFITLDGFYERVAKKDHFQIETVCNSCQRVQPV